MKACRDCHFVTEEESCPMCRGSNLSKDWLGFVHVIDASRSIIAKKMNIDANGRYALKVR